MKLVSDVEFLIIEGKEKLKAEIRPINLILWKEKTL